MGRVGIEPTTFVLEGHSTVFGAEFVVDKKTGKISIESVATNPTEFTKVEKLANKHKG